MTSNEHLDISWDEWVSRKYVSKVRYCRETNQEFTLSLMAWMNMHKARKCYYTGMPLTPNNLTIDRVRSEIGYIKGNVVVCHKAVNQVKALLENPNNTFGRSELKRMITRWERWEGTNG